ncbi:unnamed protein product [Cylicostephanus goldi]|uniref:Proteasome endopeptidase complex n=1 Tax=Cylicostephanus goldi TaxID=71465 RepID=A0A3P7MYZ6_CYLGO|nr:unnamed protein product [Cylicostephanus goldi]
MFDAEIFHGLSADARVLVDRARIECQSYKLTLEDPKFTQSPGRRPFGISMLIGGFDFDGHPRLFKTEPSGAYYEYLANSTGRGEKPVREYLEEHYSDDTIKDEASTLKLVVKALSQVVQSGAQNIEIAVMKTTDVVSYLCVIVFCLFSLFFPTSYRLHDANGHFLQPGECTHRVLTVEEVEALMKVVEEEREAAEAEEAAKKKP